MRVGPRPFPSSPLSSDAVGLDLKQPRGRLLVLIVGGLIVLAAIAAGVIVISAGGSGGTGTASSGLDTSFTQPRSFESVDAVYQQEKFDCAPTDSECVRKYLVKVTDDYGPRASLGVMARLQADHRVDPAVNDHDMAHSVGRETAKDYGSNFKAFDLCPITFNYGCDHGFFEYVLARTDTPREAATTICESLNGANHFLIAGFSCYHGVGHGIMMAEAYNVQNSLKACNTMPKETAKDGCWQGVFMENVNAGMRGRALPGVFKRSDPLAPCDKVGDKYKHECYINHSGWLMTTSHATTSTKGTRYCLKAKGRFVSSCLQSVWSHGHEPSGNARSRARRPVPPAKIAADLCSRFPGGRQKGLCDRSRRQHRELRPAQRDREHALSALPFRPPTQSCYRQIGVPISARTPGTSRCSGRAAQASAPEAAPLLSRAGLA